MQIKDRNGTVLVDGEQIKERWKEYFEELLNEEFPRKSMLEEEPTEANLEKIKRQEVMDALKKMKNQKAVGPDGVPVDVFKVIGEEGVDVLLDLLNCIWEKGKMPDEWRLSTLVPIFKGKGDVQECGNYRGIALMSHVLKLWERIIEKRLRNIVEIGEGQFGFTKGKSTTDAAFAVRMLMEKYREKKVDLHLVIIDLEKAYDRVPREVVWWCMRKRKIPERCIHIVQDMYEENQMYIRSSVGESKNFAVKVGVKQGSALSPFLFIMVMDTLTRDIQKETPWNMLFADDIILCAETSKEVGEDLNRWVQRLEDNGLRVSRKKTEYLHANFSGTPMVQEVKIAGESIKKVEEFKYLGEVISAEGSLKGEVEKRVKAGWLKWRQMSGVLCDRKIPAWLKGKVYTTVVRPVLIYGAETWAIRRKEENAIMTTEMRMLRWMVGKTKKDKVRNVEVRKQCKVVEISEKLRDRRLMWFGHVERRDDDYVGKRVCNMDVGGKRGRGRPKKRWKDVLKEDMQKRGIDKALALNREGWSKAVRTTDPT